MKKLSIGIIVIVVLIGGYLLWSNKPIKNQNSSIPIRDIVMLNGQKITASTSSDTISIKAGEGLKRIYVFDGCERDLVMWPRNEEWYGKWGAYYPGPGLHWKDCGGIGRAVVQESNMYFANEKEAVEYLKQTYKAWRLVYSNDGLVVAWWKVPQRHQLNVDILQVLIGENRKPESLAGANDNSIFRE